jgi:hypothetical protein
LEGYLQHHEFAREILCEFSQSHFRNILIPKGESFEMPGTEPITFQVVTSIVKDLAEAKSSMLVQAYSFTSAPIANALVDA